jgi:hypothetical protein
LSRLQPSTLPSKNTALGARVIGALIGVYGLLTILIAAGRLLSPPPETNILVSIQQSMLWLDLLFGLALLLLGAGIVLRQAWTRDTAWMSCLVLALLIPSGFNMLSPVLDGLGLGQSVPFLVTPAVQAALLVLAAILLYRNPPPDPAALTGTRPRRPRITSLSRTIGVLLVLAGLTRLWLSLAIGTETLDKLWQLVGTDPRYSLAIVTTLVWSVGLGLATIVAAFGIGLRRPWGIALGLPVSFAGVLLDIQAAIRFPSSLGPEYLDWVILRYASAILYAVAFLYCAVQLLRASRPAQGAPQQAIHYPPDVRPTVADDANWRETLLASLRAAGAQPAPKHVITGMILPIFGIILIGGGWALLNVLVRLNPPAGSSGPNLALTVLLTVALAATAILLIERLVAFFARRIWRFRARSAEQELERTGSRRPVLYLRSFALDEETARPSAGELLLGMTPTASAEQMLAKVLSRRKGPVIAIGMPGEKLPGLGAARFYASHEVWHQKIADAAQVSQLVVWTTGTTEGLRWEISHLLKSIPPAKLLVWTHPPLLRVGRAEREQEWSAFLATLGKAFPRALPERLGKTRFIWFRDNWEPVPVSPRWGFFGGLFRIFRNAQTVALKQLLRQKSAPAQM